MEENVREERLRGEGELLGLLFPFSLFRTCQAGGPGSDVENVAGALDLIKSAHVSLQRGDPGLNHP